MAPKSKKKSQKKGKNKPNPPPTKKEQELHESHPPQPVDNDEQNQGTAGVNDAAAPSTDSVAPQQERDIKTTGAALDISSDAVKQAVDECVKASVVDVHALVKQLQSFAPPDHEASSSSRQQQQQDGQSINKKKEAAPAAVAKSDTKELGKDAVQAAINSTIAASAIKTDKLVPPMDSTTPNYGKRLPPQKSKAAQKPTGESNKVSPQQQPAKSDKPLPAAPVPAGAVDAAIESAVKGSALQEKQPAAAPIAGKQQQPQRPEPAVSPPLQASQVNPHAPVHEMRAAPVTNQPRAPAAPAPSQQQQHHPVKQSSRFCNIV